MGDFNAQNYSIQALRMFCRNDTWRVMPSIVRDPETGEPLDQVVPNKTRCGSEDPVEMSLDNKCYCWPKEDKGASMFLTSSIHFCFHRKQLLLAQFQWQEE